MPISNHIDVARGTVSSTFSGAVTVEEVRALAEALRDDPDFRPDLNQMIDLRATEVAISTDDIKGLARISPFGEGSRRALVVASDVLFGLSRICEIWGEESGAEVDVFKDYQEAMAWLGLEEVGS